MKKIGFWIPTQITADSTKFKCSLCEREIIQTNDYYGKPSVWVHEYFPYCHCGAKMQKEIK